MVEVKMENSEQAIILRKAYAEKKKNKTLGPDLDFLLLAKCVSLATRVSRVDVLKAVERPSPDKPCRSRIRCRLYLSSNDEH
jgi:hypothetical protein